MSNELETNENKVQPLTSKNKQKIGDLEPSIQIQEVVVNTQTVTSNSHVKDEDVVETVKDTLQKSDEFTECAEKALKGEITSSEDEKENIKEVSKEKIGAVREDIDELMK